LRARIIGCCSSLPRGGEVCVLYSAILQHFLITIDGDYQGIYPVDRWIPCQDVHLLRAPTYSYRLSRTLPDDRMVSAAPSYRYGPRCCARGRLIRIPTALREVGPISIPTFGGFAPPHSGPVRLRVSGGNPPPRTGFRRCEASESHPSKCLQTMDTHQSTHRPNPPAPPPYTQHPPTRPPT
jgi:hypothetical protein